MKHFDARVVGKEEQVSTADAKISRITDRLQGIDNPLGRQTLAE
jgi:hypothetical protein